MHVDQEAIERDFIDNNKDLLEEFKLQHYCQCNECKEWFDSVLDLKGSRPDYVFLCKDCREQERNETKEER